jgi:hypothetical protein
MDDQLAQARDLLEHSPRYRVHLHHDPVTGSLDYDRIICIDCGYQVVPIEDLIAHDRDRHRHIT